MCHSGTLARRLREGPKMLETFIAALAAALLALVGNYFMLGLQTRARVREELRAFVRELHDETVALVVDLDLFVRATRGAALAGCERESELQETRDRIEREWEGDLLRRVRKVRYGHPDADVRDASERLDDDMWPFIVMARSPYREEVGIPLPPKTPQQRSEATRAVDEAMVVLRRTVYAAPHHDVSPVRYAGMEIPSRLSRALARDASQGDG